MTLTLAAPHTRQQVYAAEHRLREVLDNAGLAPTFEIYGSKVVLPPEAKFGDLETVQRYVDKVYGLAWIRDYPGGQIKVRVRKRRGTKFAHYDAFNSTIAIPLGDGWALRELVVLHEYAHHLSWGHGHDEVFVGTYTDLIERIIGNEAAFLFRIFCDLEGVKIG